MRNVSLILLSVLLASCATTGKKEEESDGKMNISTGNITAEDYTPGGMSSNIPDSGERLSAKKEKELLELIPDSQIAFTDPDNPNADIKEIDDAFARKKAGIELWDQSYDAALREARRSGKGILIWFHNNKIGQSNKELDVELFSSSDFLVWAKDNLILLRYDKSAEYRPEKRLNQYGLEISQKAITIRKQDYVNTMYERFGIRGAPSIAMVSPDGQQVDLWAGYKKGTRDSVWERIKNNVNISNEKYVNFKKRLIAQGYKDWRGRNGSSIFAKFTRYDEKKSNVWLRELDGYQTKTKLASLISEDQQWVLDETQKKKE